jgi:mannose-1-phosphate guanylyltransferase/phosphomannomutase
VVTMNRDQHRGSRMLKRALMAGIVSTGVHVADLSQVPIPIGRFHTRRTNAAGGAHVRISPFDDRVVDIKLYDGHALDINKATERRIENVFFREDFRRVSYDGVGRIFEATRVGEAYSEAFLSFVQRRPQIADAGFKIVVNYSQGTASLFLPQLLHALGCDAIGIHANVAETVGYRSLENFQESMRELAAITGTLRAHFGVTLDAGGEKIFLVDDRGRVVSDLAALAIMTRLVLEDTQGGTVGVPVYAPQAIEQLATERGGRIVRVRASAESQMQAAARDRPDYLGDGLGGFILPAFQPCFDGLMAIAKLLELLAVRARPLSSFVDEVPPFHMARLRVDCPWEEKGRVMRMLAEEPATAATRQIDGVKHVYDGEWVLVLPDIDYPRFNLWAEGASEGTAQALVQRYAERVERLRQA